MARGRNILAERLPAEARLIRGWSGHPYDMLQELDESFYAVALVGWHGPAGHPNNPLSHTLTGFYGKLTLNDVPCSEYLLHAHVRGLVWRARGFPVRRPGDLPAGSRDQSSDHDGGNEYWSR